VLDQVDQAVRVEVRDADRSGQPVGVGPLHRAPEAVVVAERLVDQVEVDAVEPEPLQRPVERGLGPRLAGVLDPQLRGDEQLVTRDAAAAQGAADGLLVPVGGCGVDEPVPDLERSGDGLFGFLRRDLVDAEPRTGISTPLFNVTLGMLIVSPGADEGNRTPYSAWEADSGGRHSSCVPAS
jgi:hypothetical protein